MNINGLTTKVDVLTAIKESIDGGRLDMARDMLNELIREEEIEVTAKDPKTFDNTDSVDWCKSTRV